jgi:hypothetical protein
MASLAKPEAPKRIVEHMEHVWQEPHLMCMWTSFLAQNQVPSFTGRDRMKSWLCQIKDHGGNKQNPVDPILSFICLSFLSWCTCRSSFKHFL